MRLEAVLRAVRRRASECGAEKIGEFLVAQFQALRSVLEIESKEIVEGNWKVLGKY